MNSLRESYKGTWAKGAHQCKMLQAEILKCYPYLDVVFGLGADQEGEVKNTGVVPGAPDLYVQYDGFGVCEIEVTGSDKIVPQIIWVGHHKVEYMKQLKDPNEYGLFLFYGHNNQIRYFLSAREILDLIADKPEHRSIRGNAEHYYVIDSLHFKGESGFWSWLNWRLQEAGVIH